MISAMLDARALYIMLFHSDPGSMPSKKAIPSVTYYSEISGNCLEKCLKIFIVVLHSLIPYTI